MENTYLNLINAVLGTNFKSDEIKDKSFLVKVPFNVIEKLDENNLLDEDDWYYINFNPNLTLDFILKNHNKFSMYSLICGDIKDDILKQIPSEIVLDSNLTISICDEINEGIEWKEFEHIFDTFPNFIDWIYIFTYIEVDKEFNTKYFEYLLKYVQDFANKR